jgi:hypothetical protein
MQILRSYPALCVATFTLAALTMRADNFSTQAPPPTAASPQTISNLTEMVRQAEAQAAAKPEDQKKAKVEADAKKKADAKAKKEAEKKAKAEAEAKKKDDTKAREEAEAKATAEKGKSTQAATNAPAADKPATKAEAEAKKKADAKARKEAEAKAKAEKGKPSQTAADAPVVKKGTPVKPLESPPLPISADKDQRLQELLKKYRADQLTPEQYQAERAKILAEP